MKKNIFWVLLCGVFLISGCATAEKGRHPGESVYHMYTNAPKDIVFDVSCQALPNVKYTIDIKDRDEYVLRGTRHYFSLPGYPKEFSYATIEIEEETTGVKVTCIIDRPTAINAFGINRGYANEIYKEINKSLSAKGYKLQKGKGL